MKAFIAASLILLGLAFYELSGGGDFDPEAARAKVLEARLARDAARETTQRVLPRAVPDDGSLPVAAVSPPRAEQQFDDTDDSNRLKLRTFNSVASTAVDEPEPRPVPAPTTPEPLSITALNQTNARAEPVAFAGNSVTASSSAVDQDRDIRVVRGTVVNVRSGPGTEYDVVTKLPQATRVEVLTDTGNGWVELRPVAGGDTGWIAAFLLTEG